MGLQAWGVAGFEAHLRKLQGSLRARCDALVAAADKHLGDVAAWKRPKAGMFLWIKLHRPPQEISKLLTLMEEHGVVAMPGNYCKSPGSRGNLCPYVRLSFVIDEGEYSEAMTRFASLA